MLVIGGGIAALCAALAAREAGAGVCLLEQAPRTGRGGNTRHSRNFRVAHAAPTPFSPGRYTEAEFLAELAQAAEGQQDPALASLLVSGSAELPDWLGSHGVVLQRVADGGLPPSRRTVFCFGGGMAMLNALYARAERLGIAIRYGSTAEALRLAAGRLAGLTVTEDGQRREVRPRAVVACCGGYQGNPDRLRPHWGEAADRLVLRGVPQAAGGILFDLLGQGAAPVGEPGACHLVAVDARSPAADGGIVTRVTGIPEGIVVDRSARRFQEETAAMGQNRYAIWGRLVAGRPGQIAWLILDAEGEARQRPPIFPPIQAETLAGLAAAIGLDPAVLAATVAEANATRKRPVAEPPFTAIPIRPGITFTCHGVRVDSSARVVMADGSMAADVFAAGMIMAPSLLGTGYLAGAAITIGAVFGRIAGTAAARHARG